jgi:hypothetical protein
MRDNLSHLPPASADEVRAMLDRAGLALPEELFQQFLAVWPGFEAMVRRVPRARAYADEPAHTFSATRSAGG